MSLCGYTLRGDLASRAPSMMLAWLSSSEIRRSCSALISDWQTATFVVKPDWKTSAASVPLNCASRVSSSSCRVMVPMMVRTAAEPTPYFLVAASAASTRRGWVVRPR